MFEEMISKRAIIYTNTSWNRKERLEDIHLFPNNFLALFKAFKNPGEQIPAGPNLWAKCEKKCFILRGIESTWTFSLDLEELEKLYFILKVFGYEGLKWIRIVHKKTNKKEVLGE